MSTSRSAGRSMRAPSARSAGESIESGDALRTPATSLADGTSDAHGSDGSTRVGSGVEPTPQAQRTRGATPIQASQRGPGACDGPSLESPAQPRANLPRITSTPKVDSPLTESEVPFRPAAPSPNVRRPAGGRDWSESRPSATGWASPLEGPALPGGPPGLPWWAPFGTRRREHRRPVPAPAKGSRRPACPWVRLVVGTSCAAGLGGSRIGDVPGGYRGNHKAGASRRKGSRPPSGRRVRAR